MRDSKRLKKTTQEQEKLVSTSYFDLCEEKEGESSLNAKPLRVRFILPEENSKEPNHTTNREIITLHTLPSICEFTMFSSNGPPANKPEKQISQARTLTKLPPMYSNARLGKIDGAATELAANKKAQSTNKGPITCTKKDIRMEIKCKLPEDYRDPTYKETKKRIWDWLRQSEDHQPAYMRRANAFRKTVSLRDNTG